MALFLRTWLPSVVQASRPWMSEVDTGKGRQWAERLTAQLELSAVGIFCLVPENLQAEWLLYEAGAVAKHRGEARVHCMLLGLRNGDVREPLGLYQSTEALNHDEMRELILSVNDSAGPLRIPAEACTMAFERGWPELREALMAIDAEPPPEEAPVRDNREILEEMLGILRRYESTVAELRSNSPGASQGDESARAQSEKLRRAEMQVRTLRELIMMQATGAAMMALMDHPRFWGGSDDPVLMARRARLQPLLDSVTPATVEAILHSLTSEEQEIFRRTVGWPRTRIAEPERCIAEGTDTKVYLPVGGTQDEVLAKVRLAIQADNQ